MRQPVEGSVEFGSKLDDPEMSYGIKKDVFDAAMMAHDERFRLASTTQDEKAADAEENLDQWITEFPEGFEVNSDTLARGQQRFNIYCAVCHGYAGNGDGLVNQRAMALAATGAAKWTTAKSLHDPTVKDAAKNPTGRIFDTITNGRNTMGPYRSQIPVEDRWAIVAYIKALQETGIEPPTTGEAAAEEAAEETTEPEEE